MNKDTALSHWSMITELRKMGWDDKQIANHLKIRMGDLLLIMRMSFFSEFREGVPKVFVKKKKKVVKKRKRRKIILYSGELRHEGADYTRWLVRKRDGHKCQLCKKEHVPGKKAMDVIFKDTKEFVGKRYIRVKDTDKLITVCHKCNYKIKKLNIII